MAFIDPTDQNLTGNTNYENLNIYVDLTAQRRGFTTINDNEATNIASGTFNLMGYKTDDKGSKKFTTEYTEQYNNNTDTKGLTEGFGITNISIEVNSSYVPTVKIDFVDIKGMAFFNKRENSPYSVLFDFPPPIFVLTVKGYYGKGLEYKLHMLRQNTRFEAETGNYYISAEFVANTFAPLADILYQYVLTTPKLNKKENDTDSTKPVNNLQELIIQSKNIKEVIADKLSEEFKDINKLTETAKIISSLLTNQIELKNNIKLIEINKINDTFIKNENNFKLNEFNPQSKYFLVIPVKNNLLSEGFLPTSELLLREFYLNNFYNNNRREYFNSVRDLSIQQSFDSIINGINIGEGIIFYMEITQLYLNIFKTYQNTIDERRKLINDIVPKTKDIVISKLGFTPTIYNVMEIICNDIDKWINILATTYNESITYINGNKSIISSNLRINNIDVNNFTIYPFPDYIENNKKSIPKGILSNTPEVKLVDDFIVAFIEHRKELNKEPISTDEITDINGINVWFPINPMDSRYIKTTNLSPYYGSLDTENIIRKIFARYYVYNYFTLTSSVNDPQIFATTIANFFESEFNNIKFSINQPNILRVLKNYNLPKDDKFKTALNEKLKSLFIKEEDINNILNNLDVNKKIEFSGIRFSSEKNKLNTDITKDSIKSFKYYLNSATEPKNNYFKRFGDGLILIGSSKYELNQLEPTDFGLTLNDKNNIIYYDGNDNNKTSFESFNISSKNIFDDIINESLNIKTPEIMSSNTINNTNNINNIIFDYYNDSDEFKKYFGYLNIIYVPDLKHIITVLMNKAIIAEMPFLVKLYISSYVYAIENNFIDVDLNKFNENDKSKFDENNKDFIFNLYNILLPGGINNNLITNFGRILRLNTLHLKIRKDFINLLNNLTPTDKDIFIDFYENTIKDTFFKNSFERFINEIRKNDSFSNIKYDLSKIQEKSILNDLKEKTAIIVKSNYTFSNKENFNIFDNFENITEINKNIELSFRNDDFKDNLKTLFIKFQTQLDDRIKELDKNNENELLISSNRNKNTFDSIRTETYYSFKSFVDRWFTPLNGGDRVGNNRGFLTTDPNVKGDKLLDLFTFVNRFYDDNEAKNTIIDTTILADFENNMNVNMLTVIGRLLNHNGFEFYPLQNFIDYTNKGEDNNWRADNVFGAEIGRRNVLYGPRFTCMYIGGKSMYLDSGSNNNSVFKNDGFNSNNPPNDSEPVSGSTKWFGFLVKFGDGKQSIFTNIELNTEEHQPTNESLSAMSQILDSEPNTPVPQHQNLFSTYEQRSYTCKIKMFGNVMIQPTQLFDLRNVPMFSGVYIILKVNHNIDGETNSMITEFEGVRLPRESKPFIIEPFEIYGKDFVDNLDEYSGIITSTRSLPQKELERKDRKIFLVAGHGNNEPGAVFENFTENTLNIELRGLIQNYLKLNNIDFGIVDDNLTIGQVIEDLKNRANPDDIIIVIHFNSAETRGDGTEVFIKDGTNPSIIDLGEKVLKAITTTLSTTPRGNLSGLPNGIKTSEQSDRGTLGMFDINANVILIEVCFINNRDEMRLYNQNKQKLAEAIGNVLIGATITETDKAFKNVKTYEILNQFKYDKIDGIMGNFSTNKQKIKSNGIKIIGDNYYKKGKNISDVFENINENDYMDLVLNQVEITSIKYDLDPIFLSGILYIESQFFPSNQSDRGALGISQFTSIAFLEVFRYLQNNSNLTTSLYLLNKNTNNFELKNNVKFSEIISIMFDGKNYDFRNYNENQFKNKLRPLIIKNVFNNPFIMIEFAGILLDLTKGYSNTKENKNMGILAISYNMGSVTRSYNESADKIYFENLRAKYKNGNKDQKNKIAGLVRNEGIKYPERLIDDFLVLFGFLKSPFDKGNINI